MKNCWKYFCQVTVAGAIAVVAVGAFAQDADLSQRRDLAVKVVQANMQAVDSGKLVASTAEAMKAGLVNNLKRTNPNLPAEYYAKVADVAAREAAPLLESAMAELFPPMMAILADNYAQKFTLQELADLVKIYEMPVVRRATSIAIESMPKLMEPMMQSFAQRAQTMVPRITQALTREGLLPPPKP